MVSWEFVSSLLVSGRSCLSHLLLVLASHDILLSNLHFQISYFSYLQTDSLRFSLDLQSPSYFFVLPYLHLASHFSHCITLLYLREEEEEKEQKERRKKNQPDSNQPIQLDFYKQTYRFHDFYITLQGL